MQREVAEVARRFALMGKVTGVVEHAGGHINRSFLVTTDGQGGQRRYIIQRINAEVFPEPAALMENVVRVTEHIAERSRLGEVDSGREAVMLVLTLEGRPWQRAVDGAVWRAFPFVESCETLRTPDSPLRVRRAAAAFGEFARMLLDLPPPRLHDTIPGFHDTPRRYAALEAALQADALGRAAGARAEIDFAMQRREGAGVLVELERSRAIPERVAHYDAKLANVLFDARSGEALCVIDFDTVMAGSVLYDFGDMVRSMTSGAAERGEAELDEQRARPPGAGRDGEQAEIELPLFEALADGYLAVADFLTQTEREHLVTAGRIITLEQGVRFLTDHLEGDHYYRATRPGTNLERARRHFSLVGSIERRRGDLETVISSL
jgi:hypothetical protein